MRKQRLLIPLILALAVPATEMRGASKGPPGHAGPGGPQAHLPGGSGAGTPPPGLGCSATSERFCDELYSKKNRGNLDLRAGDRTLGIRLGETPNGFDGAFFAFESAKLQSKDRLPSDFVRWLNQDHYFEKLDQYLKTRSLKSLSRLEKLRVTRTASELSTIWNQAFEAAGLERVERTHPGYGARQTVPAAWARDYAEIEDQLGRDIYSAIWKESPAWKKVERDFQQVREEYLKELQEMHGLPAELRQEWIERISSVKLVVPGTDPDGNLQEDCPTTAWNAFYRPDNHTVTVCAGAFNSGEFQAVLAHELSHALGLSRSRFVFELNSKLGKQLAGLRDKVCKNSPLENCPDEWAKLKKEMPEDLNELSRFQPSVPEFLECLQYKQITRSPTPEIMGEMAMGQVRSMTADNADNHAFLTLIEKEIPRRNGTEEPNTRYLNPCEKRVPKTAEYDPDNSLLLMFTLEYLCDSKGSSAERLHRAALEATRLQGEILQKTMAMGGKFSESPMMAQYGLAESAEERFADNLGFRVFARILRKSPSVLDRRALFDANLAGFCDPNSLVKKHPRAAQAEKELSLEAHSLARKRREETLIQPIREALDCQKDFQGKDCHL